MTATDTQPDATANIGIPIIPTGPRRGRGKPALPPEQKIVKETVGAVRDDWEFLRLWSGEDPDMDTPSHWFRELIAYARRMHPQGPHAFGRTGKKPRHVMPGHKLTQFGEREGLTNREAAALIVARYIKEHPEQF